MNSTTRRRSQWQQPRSQAKGKWFSFPHDESGGVAVITAFCLIVLIGFAALVIDVGHLQAVRNELQNGADACALRGARAFYADVEPIAEPADELRAKTQANDAVGDNYSDRLSLKDLSNVVTGVWDFENHNWLGGTPVFTWPPDISNWGKIIGPGISLITKKEAAQNDGPVRMILAQVLGSSAVPVGTLATAALSPLGNYDPSNSPTGIPPPLRISEAAAKLGEGTFTLYPNNSQWGGWHAYDIAHPNVPLLKDLVWGIDTKTGDPVTKTGDPIDIPNLSTAPQEGYITEIMLQNGVDAKLFMVPDPTKPNDPNQWSLLSRWLFETGQTMDPKTGVVTKDPFSTKPDAWTVRLPVTSTEYASGTVKVVGFVDVKITKVSPPPAKTIEVNITKVEKVAAQGSGGGGKYFGIIALDPKLVR
ncbi:MAG: Tad domain-containing protein [Pseudomonadota bacterium]